MSKGVEILYGNVAVGAKENFNPNSPTSQFNNLNQLKEENAGYNNYVNPCEMYQVLLDGNGNPLPSNVNEKHVGFWGAYTSDDEGNFLQPITLYLISNKAFSSNGIQFTFDNYNNVYPTELEITWRNGTKILAKEKFYPNSSVYFCEKEVDNYTSLAIIFYSLNIPQNRLKILSIEYGNGFLISASDLKSVKLIQEIDPISSSLPINTASISLSSKNNLDFDFTYGQPIKIFFNGKLKEHVFVSDSKRTSKKEWKIEAENYIGILDNVEYAGGYYLNEYARDIISNIFSTANVPYELDEYFNDFIVNGYIPYTTCREALMQVAFAIQAVVDTSNKDFVKISMLDDDLKQTIPLNRILSGQKISTNQKLDSLQIAEHKYSPSYKENYEYEIIYDSENAGIYDDSGHFKGKNREIFVKHSNPFFEMAWDQHDIVVGYTFLYENDKKVFLEYSGYGEIVEKNANFTKFVMPYTLEKDENNKIRYFAVAARASLKDEKIIHKKENEDYSVSKKGREVSIENATLISYKNVDNVLEKCYNEYSKNIETSMKIVEGKKTQYGDFVKYGSKKYGELIYKEKNPNVVFRDEPVNLGDVIEFETEYSGKKSGRIIKQTFNLNGNIIVKDVIVR